jgi:hypothetical protein
MAPIFIINHALHMNRVASSVSEGPDYARGVLKRLGFGRSASTVVTQFSSNILVRRRCPHDALFADRKHRSIREIEELRSPQVVQSWLESNQFRAGIAN